MRKSREVRRVVLKVGTHVLTEDGKIAIERIDALVKLIDEVMVSGTEVVLVSSGAVAAGYTKVPLDKSIVANRQALASIGQPLLLSIYQEAFAKFDIISSQVLLSADVFASDEQISHAKNAVDALLENGVVPIVNENDTVSIDELVFGDNDRLSAHVAHYFDANLLVILSDIDALYDKDPNKHTDAKRRDTVTHISMDELEQESTPNGAFATGGIVTKLHSADFLMKHNREMFLTSGFDLSDAKAMLVDGIHKGGTVFVKE